MLTSKQLHDYQKEAILFQLYHDYSMLWMGTGLGKSATTLTSIAHRIKVGKVKKTLIVAPIRVLYSVWDNIESKKWEHTQHLKATIIHGSVKDRVTKLFNPSYDIYGVNYEGLNWLADQLLKNYINKGLPIPFDMVVYDEVSKLKNSQSVRFKGGFKEEVVDGVARKRKVNGWNQVAPHFKYRTGLTATPAPNGKIDLFGQYLALDDGDRLGKYLTHFRNNYFQSDYMGYSYEVTEVGNKLIDDKIKDITVSMQSKDYLDMPDVVYSTVFVDLPSKARKHYEEIERQLFTELDSGTEVELQSATGVGNKCLQIANGAVYTHTAEDDHVTWESVHDEKLKALKDVIDEAGGSPVLLLYSYKTDAEKIMKKFKKTKPINLTAEKATDTAKILKKWNTGEIKLLIGHAASISHGIDGLQKACNTVVWFGLNYSLELYQQANGRIDRQGQTKSVSIIHILGKDTLDEVVLTALGSKEETQTGLMDKIKQYRESKR